MTTENRAEVLDFVERFSFNLGNAIECISRAGGKPRKAIIAELERAHWYLEREIKRIEQDHKETESSSPSSPTRPLSHVHQLGKSQQNGTIWQDRMGDKYRSNNGTWEYQTAGQNNWEPVRFDEILTAFGPYTPAVDS
jgi:hypothetical protein